MPFASFLGEIVKSGKVTFSKGNVEALEITAADKKIDVKALNKEIVKDAIAAARGTPEGKGVGAAIKGTIKQIKTAQSSIGLLKEMAEDLSQAGITVTLTYKNSVVVTLGADANPKFSEVATGTKAIEVNSPRKLIELGI